MRKPDEITMIKNKRRISYFLSVIVLAIGWIMIYFGTFFENDLQDWSLLFSSNSFIGEWTPTLIMTFVNYFIPWVLKIVGKIEQWDFSQEVLYADLWKNYYTTMLNIFVFLWLQFEKL